jgi:hypothetical protein
VKGSLPSFLPSFLSSFLPHSLPSFLPPFLPSSLPSSFSPFLSSFSFLETGSDYVAQTGLELMVFPPLQKDPCDLLIDVCYHAQLQKYFLNICEMSFQNNRQNFLTKNYPYENQHKKLTRG